MPPPSVAAPMRDGPSSATPAALSYCAVASKPSLTTPRLVHVPLVYRPAAYVDNTPALLLTPMEEELLRKQRENTLIMKFTSQHPNLYEIRSHIHTEWNLESPPAVGELDVRHVTIHMASTTDTKRALAHPANKVKESLFRLFRWTPDFEIGKDSSFTVVWVRFYDFPLHYFNEASYYIDLAPFSVRFSGYIKAQQL